MLRKLLCSSQLNVAGRNELDQHAAHRFGVQESDLMTTCTGARLMIDERYAAAG